MPYITINNQPDNISITTSAVPGSYTPSGYILSPSGYNPSIGIFTIEVAPYNTELFDLKFYNYIFTYDWYVYTDRMFSNTSTPSAPFAGGRQWIHTDFTETKASRLLGYDAFFSQLPVMGYPWNNNNQYKCKVSVQIRRKGTVTVVAQENIESSAATLTVSSAPHLFDKTSFQVVPQPYRNFLNIAADRWNTYIKYSDYSRSIFQRIYFHQSSDDVQIVNPGSSPSSNYVQWSGLRITNPSAFSIGENPDGFDFPSTTITNPVKARPKILWPLENGVPVVTGNWQGMQKNALSFSLNINTLWATSGNPFGNPLSTGEWIDLFTRELGHALGAYSFGSLNNSWNTGVPPLIVTGGPILGPININNSSSIKQRTFLNGKFYPNTLQAYKDITRDRKKQHIPIFADPIPGSTGLFYNLHTDFRYTPRDLRTNTDYPGISNDAVGVWPVAVDESDFIKNPDILKTTPTSLISKLPINFLKDMGYQEVNPGTSDGSPRLRTLLSTPSRYPSA